MTDNNLTIDLVLEGDPRDAIEAIGDVRGWWASDLIGPSADVGDEFVYEVPGIHRSRIRVTEVVPGERVVWRVVENWFGFAEDDWTGTDVRFEVDASDGQSRLRFTHEGLRPGLPCFDACQAGWHFYIGTSLRELIETGAGRPGGMPEQVAALAAQREPQG